jgi:phosphatidate cytidylyltransferase
VLRWRLLSAAVIIPSVLVLVGLDYQCGNPGAWLLPLLLTLTGMAAWEVLGLLHAGGHHPRKALTTLAAIAVAASFCGPIVLPQYFPAGITSFTPPFVAITIAVLAALSWELPRYNGDDKTLVFGFLSPLRLWHDNAWGMIALVSMLTITKFADTGAFVFGKTLGRTKLSPLLSPGKTVEGALGGVLTACVVAWLLQRFLIPWLVVGPVREQSLAWVVYGFLLTLAGMAGDLVESLLKREMHTKDSSRWLPGLGGVMDIVDSILFAAPVAYGCWSLGLIGP